MSLAQGVFVNKNALVFALTLLTISSTSILSAAQSMFIGTIQFPTELKKVPSLRIYYGGSKITGEPNDRTKQLIFSIPEIGESKKFHIVITESIQFEIEENTVKYIKLAPKQAYKCVEVEQIKHESLQTQDTRPGEFDGARLVIPESKISYTWRVTKKGLDNNRQLPDNTIVLCLSPAYIDRIEGGSKAELPRIFIKPDLLDIVGSEKKLHDEETELLLSAIDYDALHSKITQAIKNPNPTETIIACKTCV
jgi:hypothetical protein